LLPEAEDVGGLGVLFCLSNQPCNWVATKLRTVIRSLYFACGIPGAFKHLAGIGSASKIVAINSDHRHAPIF